MTYLQVKTSHEESGAGEACAVEVSVNGSSYKAVGSVQAGVPVLSELNGCVFRQPVPLSGHLVFFKAMNSTQLLLSVTGKYTQTSFSHFTESSKVGNIACFQY